MAVDNLFAQGARLVHEEAVELTLASLRAYWNDHEHVAVAWSATTCAREQGRLPLLRKRGGVPPLSLSR